MSDAIIPKHHVQTSFGEIAYLATGRDDRPPVLFVHGIPTSSYLWRHVLRFLQDDFRCFAPDLMGLGDTVVPADGAFHMDAQAEMLVEFMEKMGHRQFALVCHDQGGAAAQIIAARMPQRVSCLVLTDCVCYDNWPVPVIKRLQRMARRRWLSDLVSRTGVTEWMETSTRFSAFRRGVHDPSKLSTATIREYLRPMRESREGRERFRSFLLAGDARYTELAVDGLRRFDRPTQVIWAGDDHYLSPSWGHKLFEEIPGAERFDLVPFCGHFWQEERPAEFASLMSRFLAGHLRVPVAELAAPIAEAVCRPHLPVVEQGR